MASRHYRRNGIREGCSIVEVSDRLAWPDWWHDNHKWSKLCLSHVCRMTCPLRNKIWQLHSSNTEWVYPASILDKLTPFFRHKNCWHATPCSLNPTKISVVWQVKMPAHHEFVVDYFVRIISTAHNVEPKAGNVYISILSTATITVYNKRLCQRRVILLDASASMIRCLGSPWMPGSHSTCA